MSIVSTAIAIQASANASRARIASEDTLRLQCSSTYKASICDDVCVSVDSTKIQNLSFFKATYSYVQTNECINVAPIVWQDTSLRTETITSIILVFVIITVSFVVYIVNSNNNYF